jgi:hypothetical protein
MRLGVIKPVALAAALFATAISPALAAPKFLGKSGNWRAYSNNNEHGLFCYAVSQPIATAGGGGRGRTFFMISDQPVRNVVEEPQIISGYDAHGSSTMTVSVGGKAFDFFLQGGNGWLVRLSENAQLMQALRGSASAVITGVGPGSLAIRDTYDLSGLAQAMAKARTACGSPIAIAPVSPSRG